MAFVHTLEASALDDTLEVFEMLAHEVFAKAKKADQKARMRSLKDLDVAATALAEACAVVLDATLPDENVRAAVFSRVPRSEMAQALDDVRKLVRPPDDVFYRALDAHHRRVRRFLPALLKHVSFIAAPAGEPVVEACGYLRDREHRHAAGRKPPLAVVTRAWERHVMREDGGLDDHAYVFCVLDRLRNALRRRDVFVTPSWRYADPRSGLLAGSEWEAARPIVCRSLGYTPDVEPVLAALTEELDQTYRRVVARLPDNPAVRFERVDDKDDLVLSPLDKVDEPPSLEDLRDRVAARMPRAELPEIMLEIAVRTGFTKAFTHITDRNARAEDVMISLCAMLLGAATNTGMEPLVRNDISALRRDRLSWVAQNYFRNETITAANAMLVSAQNGIELAQRWGGGDVASADGMRFVVPVRTIHAGPNPKYYGMGKGATWYNMMSDQFTGLNGIVVPGTLRDSLVLLAVVLEQQTELQSRHIITDTGAYSDIVFGLFRLLGFRFSPRLADIGGARFWRIDPKADYGPLNAIAHHQIKPRLIVPRYREGQEDQLGALGLVVNIIVLWNTIYMDAALKQLRKEGYLVRDEDEARLAPTLLKHINMMGKYSFVMPESVARGELRPLRDPSEDLP